MNFNFVVADFMPDYIRRIFGSFDGTDKEWCKLDSVMDSWSDLEFNALSLLLNSQEMVEVYEYIAQYKLSDQMWRSLLIEGFVYSYSIIKKDGEKRAKAFAEMESYTLHNLSKALHKVCAALYSTEMYIMTDGADEGFYGELSDAVEEAHLPILNILRLITKQHWAENYYQFLTDPKLEGDLDWYDRNVTKMKEKEAPWIDDMNLDFKSISIDLTDYIATELFSKYRVPYRQFISFSLERIGCICDENKRRKVRFKKHTKTIPSELSYIYLEEKFWIIICSLLFNLSPEHINDTDNIQRDYRKVNGIKDLE